MLRHYITAFDDKAGVRGPEIQARVRGSRKGK
jgi:hypothetical protein